MKITYLSLILFLFLSACSSNDHEAKDELLTGTVWEVNEQVNEEWDDRDAVTEYMPIEEFLQRYPSVAHQVKDRSVKELRDTVKKVADVKKSLAFKDYSCIYNAYEKGVLTVMSYEETAQTYVLQEKEYFLGGLHFRVMADGVYQYADEEGQWKKYVALDNFSARVRVLSLIGRHNEKFEKKQEAIEMVYSRTEKLVSMLKGNMKWAGRLDEGYGKMEVLQQFPDREMIGVFHRK